MSACFALQHRLLVCSLPPKTAPTSSSTCGRFVCVPLSRMPGFCSFSRMVRRVSRKPGFSSACESPSASSPASCLPNTVFQAQTYSLQLSLCLPAVVGICCECGLNATPQAGSVHIESQAAAEPCADQRCSSGEFGGDGKKGCGIARPLGSLWCCHGTGCGCVKQ